MTQKINPANVRAELRLTQEELAHAAQLSKNVILNFEKRRPVQRISAVAILQALNVFRFREGLAPLTLGDLEIRIRGENAPEE